MIGPAGLSLTFKHRGNVPTTAIILISPQFNCIREEAGNHKAFLMKSGRPRRSRAAPASFAPAVNFATKFNAFSAIERERGTFHVRCLLQWFTRPTTFVFTALCLLVAPSLWFTSRSTAPAPPFPVKREGRRRAQLLRAPPRNGVWTAVMSPAEEITLPTPAEAERLKEPSTVGRPTKAPQTPVPSALASGRRENRGPGGHSRELREDKKKSSRTPPVLPVEVFRDVPPEECVRSPLWEKRVDASKYEFGCEEINVSHAKLLYRMLRCYVALPQPCC